MSITRYNFFGTSRGNVWGSNFMDMSEQEISDAILTSLSFLRLTAQSYCLVKNLLSPLITTMKALAPRTCELATVQEIVVELAECDAEWGDSLRAEIYNLGAPAQQEMT